MGAPTVRQELGLSRGTLQNELLCLLQLLLQRQLRLFFGHGGGYTHTRSNGEKTRHRPK